MFGTNIEHLLIKLITMKLRLSLFLTILSVSTLSICAQTKGTLPVLNLTDLNGKTVSSADIKKDEKITIISFWATWCPPCKKELNNISEEYTDWQKKYNLKVVAISIDDIKSSNKIKPYMDEHHWNFQVLLDISQDLKRALNIQNVPFTLLLDKNGKIVYTRSGYTEGDEAILEEEIQKISKN